MKFWTKLSTAGKVAASITAIVVCFSTLGGAAWATYSHFQTDKEAIAGRLLITEMHAADKVSAEQARRNDRVDRLERDNAKYEKDNLKPDLPTVEREFNNRQIKKNDLKIECINKREC